MEPLGMEPLGMGMVPLEIVLLLAKLRRVQPAATPTGACPVGGGVAHVRCCGSINHGTKRIRARLPAQ